MTEDIEIKQSGIYLSGRESQYKYYIHDLTFSACVNFTSNLERKACMLCEIFIFKTFTKKKKKKKDNFQINF